MSPDNVLIIANDVLLANTFFTRLLGLLKQKRLTKGQALLLSPCWAVHTFFLFYEIDILFLDEENKIVKVVNCLKPFRFACAWNAKAVLELPAGSLASRKVRAGGKLVFEGSIAKLSAS